MNLRTLLPSVSDNVHHALENAGFTTAHDILFTPISQIYARLNPSVLSLCALTDLKAQVIRLVSAPAMRGDELFARDKERKKARELCPCGVAELDALLGGFGTHGVIEIAGGKRSGKSGLVLQIVLCHLACYPDHKVFWLDTGGEFTVERAVDILHLNPGLGSETALDRLSVSTCFDVAVAHRALENLRISLMQERDGAQRTRFIVIDPLTPLFAPILSAASSQGHAIMTTFMHLLSSLARTYSLTALVTNTSVKSLQHNPYSAFASTTTKPALGPSFTFLTDETLWLASARDIMSDEERPQDTEVDVFVAEVFRSRSNLSRTWCVFVIRNGVSFERLVPVLPGVPREHRVERLACAGGASTGDVHRKVLGEESGSEDKDWGEGE